MISTLITSGYPLSRAILVIVVLVAIAVAVVLGITGRSGRIGAGILSVTGVGVVLALTLSPVGSSTVRSSSCNLEPYNYVGDTANVVLFLVPMIFVVVATRSPLLLGVLGPMTSAAIELAQYAMPELGRRCDVDDLLANSAGATLGVLIGSVILGVAALIRRRPPVTDDARERRTTVLSAEYR